MSRPASGPIRSKYFIQSKTVGHAGNVKYELGAVIPDYGNEPAGPDAGYHQATPSGEAMFHYHIGRDPGLEPDIHVMLLWTPIDDTFEVEGDHWWLLKKRTEYEHGMIEYLLAPAGKDRPFSWKTEFNITVDRAFTAAEFGTPGQRFLMELSPL